MRIRISWPTGIVIAIGAFVIFILSFVFKVMLLPEYDHHLVSEDYYKEELLYQQEIDKMNNGNALEKNVEIQKGTDGIRIIFPEEFDFTNITGTIYFQRMSNDKIDFQKTIELRSHEFLIADSELVDGRWDIKVEWSVNEINYLLKEKITY